MALVTYPAACKPRAQNWTLTTPVQRSRSAWSGREKRLILTGTRWSVQCEVIPMRLATYQAWQSFTAQLEGSANTFQLYATPTTQTGPATATWAMNGTGVVSGSLTACRVTGLTVSSTNMTAGQMITVDNRLYVLTANVVADSSGNATVSIKPSLATATTSASIATVQRPYALVTMTDPPSVSIEPGPIYRASFNAEEVY